jgi:K+:H+ antiporter
VVSIAFGVYAHGRIDLFSIAKSLAGLVAFIVLSFLVGRRLVFRVIRWANDSFVTEVPVITAILVTTGIMALVTESIGVTTVLGAFVAGVLIGQSPILTRHIDQQLRGLIFALFMPIFFGLAGSTTDLTVLAKPNLLILASGLVAIGGLGKFAGVLLGGRLGGMTRRDALAVGFGMNARGSTEIILASIGLSIGALNEGLFTAIIAMAMVTTLSMPPLLRWALARAPIPPEEADRLKREEFEARGFMAKIERLLVAVDASPSGRFAAWLAGLLTGARRIATTAFHVRDATVESPAEGAARVENTDAVLHQGIAIGDDAGREERSVGPVEVTTRVAEPTHEFIGKEARKGYGLLVIGHEPAWEGNVFHQQIVRNAAEFGGLFAIVIARGIERRHASTAPLNILVPVTGTSASRQAAEVGIALAGASQGSITALHVRSGGSQVHSWSGQISATLASTGTTDAIIREVVRLGDAYNVEVKGAMRSGSSPEQAILRQIESGDHNLLVLGVRPRPGPELFLGPVAGALLEQARCSLFLVAGEPLPTVG